MNTRPLRILGTLLASGTLFASQTLFLPHPTLADELGVCANPGKDGPGTISGIVNTYYPGASGATVAVGSTSIPVGPLNTAGSLMPIEAGDLLLIIQMQDATINSSDTDAYGNGSGGDVTPPQGVTTAPPTLGGSGWTNLDKTGHYEYVVATGSVSGGAVPIGSGTVYSYSNQAATATRGQRTYQVVRVPQYASGTITGAVTTSARWNGSSGGIVAFDVAGALNLGGGTVDVNGLGFRGGGSNPNNYSGESRTTYRSTDNGLQTGVDGPKGEGIAGTPRLVSQQPFGSFNVRSSTVNVDNGAQGYPNGDNGRGAPATAGGGGNEHNAGGGGGANGGNGGLGGRSFNNFDKGGPHDYFVGGFGGTALSPDPTRLVLGSGGGAGDTNDQTTPSGAGGGGGGMIIIRAGTVSGSATITTRGADGIDSPLGALPDAGGGGGAGGTVLIAAASGSLPGTLTIDASGGAGGDLNENNTSELDGPGGGGGGGAVYSSGGVTVNVKGGNAGLAVNNTTVRNNTPNGATAGTDGINELVSASALTTSISGAGCIPQLAVTKTTSTPTTTAGSTATYTITVKNAAFKAAATQVDINDVLPTGFTYAALGSVNLSGGAIRTATTDPTAGATNPSFGQFTIPGGGQVQIAFTVNIDAGVAAGTYQNPATATYLDPTRTTTTGTTGANYDSASSTAEDVIVTAPVAKKPKMLLVKRITAINKVDLTEIVDGRSDVGVNAPNYVPEPYALDDNDPKWPAFYLRGAINGGVMRPGDELEYTIYFLSNGDAPITNASICDLVPENTTFIPTAFNGLTPNDGGLPSADSGLALAIGSTTPTAYLTNVNDAPDRGQFVAAGTNPSVSCSAANKNGAVAVNIVTKPATLPNATEAGTPTNSYGFIRFRARVK